MNTSPDSQLEYPYSTDTINNILALMVQAGWLNTYAHLLQAQYFPEADRPFVQGVLEYFEHYRHAPNIGDIAALVPEFPEERREKIFALSKRPQEMTHDLICKFAQVQAAKLAVLECVSIIQEGQNLEPIVQLMRNAIKVGMEEADIGIEIMDDAHRYLLPTFLRGVVPTGWRHVDPFLKGGLAAKELGLIMAPPGGGKSSCLVNIGAAAASPLVGKNVLHITLEMPAEDVAIRYASHVTQKEFEPDSDIDDYLRRLGHWGEAMLPGRVLVKEYPTKEASVTQVRSYIEGRIDAGFDPGLIIIDYPDLLKPPSFRGERREEISDTIEAVRGLAGYFKLPVWGATQSNRGSLDKEIITMADIANDIGKANTADILIAFCQTKDERKQKEARLFMAKVRKGEALALVKVRVHFDLMSIVSVGEVEQEVEEDDELALPTQEEARAALGAVRQPQEVQVNGQPTGRIIPSHAVRNLIDTE